MKPLNSYNPLFCLINVCVCGCTCVYVFTGVWMSRHMHGSQRTILESGLSSFLLRQGLSCYSCIAYSRLARDSKRPSCSRLSSYNRSTRIAGVCHHIQLVYMAPGLNPRPQVCKAGAFICWTISLALCFESWQILNAFPSYEISLSMGMKTVNTSGFEKRTNTGVSPWCRPST